jgi:Amt family ammonium transporter
LLTGFLARTSANGNLKADWIKPYVTDSVMQPLVWEQIKAIALTLALAIVGTIVIGLIVKVTIGLRPTEETESIGLDLAEHGEEGYHVEA